VSDRQHWLEETRALIDQAKEALHGLHSAVSADSHPGPDLRAIALVGTKLDEAELWLSTVKDEP
jgi:hypothetical protein